MQEPYGKTIEVRPFSAPLGAEVRCGDLRNVTTEMKREIHQAWLDHLVLVFRGQRLTDPELLQATELFGKRTISNITPKDGLYGDIAVVSNVVENGKPIGVLGAGELLWHTDHSFEERPLSASLLYSLEVPPAGGDTHFCNMYLALETMPAGLRARVEKLTIKNDTTYNSAGVQRTKDVTTDVRTSPGASHPIVRTHPETGLHALYLGRRPNAYVNGLSIEDSEALLDELWAHGTQRQFTWAHSWRVGDLVVWDNRCVMHRRDPFDSDARRVMHRAQCEGDRPVQLSGAERYRPHARGTLYAARATN